MSTYKAGDIIKLTRNALGISQEELSFDICSPQTLHRIENGKCKVKKETYRNLMERMGRSGEKNFCTLYVDDLDILDIKIKADTAMSKFEYEKTEEYIRRIKPRIKDSVINKQYIMLMETIICYRLGKMEKEEFLKTLEDIIAFTIKDYNMFLDKKYPFKCEEIEILINISNAYKEIKRYEKSIDILQMLLRSLETGYMGEKEALKLKIIIMNNMGKAYAGLDDYENSIKILERGIELAERYKIAGTLANLYAEMSWAMIQQVENGERKKEELEIVKNYLRQGYAIAAVSNGNILKSTIKKFYKEYFLEEIYLFSPSKNGESPKSSISSL